MTTTIAAKPEQLQYNKENFEALLLFFNSMDKMRSSLRRTAHNHLRDETVSSVLCETADQIEKAMKNVQPVAPTRYRGVSFGYHPAIYDLRMVFSASF